MSFDEPRADLLFKRAHLLGDSGLGHVQFPGGAGERRMAGDRLEGAQGVKRRQSVKEAHSLAALYHGCRKNDFGLSVQAPYMTGRSGRKAAN